MLQKDSSELAEVETLSFSTFSSHYKRMTSIGALSPRILVWHPTVIGLGVSPASLVGIARKRKKLLTYTQEIKRAKLERLRSTRLIHSDQNTTARHVKAVSKAKGLISLRAPIKYYKQVISHLQLINMRRFAS
jgi:hypothetical protein